MAIQIHCKYDELVNPKKLKNHPKNRNKHGQDQIDRLAELYKYHGIRHPIIVSNLSKCIMMELDPHYVDVIIARWEKFTGKKAELLNG